MGLSYLSSIASHFLNVLHRMVSIYFLLRDNENDLKFAMRCSTQFQRVVERCQNIRKHVANAFQKNVQCIFQRTFQCIFDLSLMPGFCK